MSKSKIYPISQAILASILFGASAPLSKILLGKIEPIPLAALLYIGSGTGLALLQLFLAVVKKQSIKEAKLRNSDISWLIGAIAAGGVVAPIILMVSLRNTPASTASLLLNFESVATTLIAILFFKENIGNQLWKAISCITLASIILSWDFSNQWGFSLGALGIIFSCICWGIDNNFTRNISSKNPFTIVTIKGLSAGFFSLFLAFILNSHLPNIKIILVTLILGFICYGLSTVLFVFAIRQLGSARTSALFGTAPFVGAVLAFIICGDTPSIMLFISLPIMIIGTILLLKETHIHGHKHISIQHEHKHCHTDFHHNHIHTKEQEVYDNGYHSHIHLHEQVYHFHEHAPDIHHRHAH